MIGHRIHQARQSAGLSQQELGDKTGVSAMAISKYENNQVTPSSAVMQSLARALGVRVEYFFRTFRVALGEVEYRKRSQLPRKVLKRIEGDVVEQIERYLELEEFLPASPVEPFKLPPGLPKRIESLDEIEAVSAKVRRAWELGLNPVPGLIDALEERGIRVFLSSASHGGQFDGLAARVNGIPVIVAGRDWPGDRQRFTLAHELGHLVLAGRLAEHLEEESAANRFAGAFLAPAPEVIKELGRRRSRLELGELHVLKHAYGLSMQGWLFRARDLGVVSQAAFEEMYRAFAKRGWKKKEPGSPCEPESPKLFTQLVFRARAEELISESKAAELLGKSLFEFSDMREQCALP